LSLSKQIKRRNVFNVAILYVVAAWLIPQVTGILFPQPGLPEWAFRFAFGLMVIRFPLVLLFSWIFEITRDDTRIRRASEVLGDASVTQRASHRINRAIVVLPALANDHRAAGSQAGLCKARNRPSSR
jgi:hypothetical protein